MVLWCWLSVMVMGVVLWVVVNCLSVMCMFFMWWELSDLGIGGVVILMCINFVRFVVMVLSIDIFMFR